MQVRTGGISGVSHRGDPVAGHDTLADVDGGAIEVSVQSDRAIGVAQLDPDAEALHGTRGNYDTVCDGVDGCANRVCDVDAAVQCAPSVAVFRCENAPGWHHV